MQHRTEQHTAMIYDHTNRSSKRQKKNENQLHYDIGRKICKKTNSKCNKIILLRTARTGQKDQKTPL